MLSPLIAIGLSVYLLCGLAAVSVSLGELVDEEAFLVKHLVVGIAFLPITIPAVVITAVAYLVFLLGEALRGSKIHDFLEKPIRKR